MASLGLNVLLVVAALFVVLDKDSPLRESIQAKLDARKQRQVARTLFDDIVGVSAESDTMRPRRLVEIMDYDCQFCRASQATVDSLVHAGSVHLSLLHLPTAGSAPSIWASRVSICTEGRDYFHAVHSHFMQETVTLPPVEVHSGS